MRTLLCTSFFFFNDTATTEIYTLSLHDALPIFIALGRPEVGASAYIAEIQRRLARQDRVRYQLHAMGTSLEGETADVLRSEEHTSELQSRQYLVCRLLLEKKKKIKL